MAQPPSISFADLGQGIQVAQNSGSLSTVFNFLAGEQRATPPQPYAGIPFSRDPGFVNRGDIIEQIHQRCARPPKRVALVGLGGVGKSQLAIEYAHQVAEKRAGWVFWMHAETRARLEEGFRTIADTVQLPDRDNPKANIPRLVHTWLSNPRNGTWLIVIDSGDVREVFYGTAGPGDDQGSQPLACYLPQCDHGSILITSRDKDLAFRLTGDYGNLFEIGPMSEADALTLFETRLGSLCDADKAAAAELVEALERIPLAISQAAAHIRRRAPRTSVSRYLAEFQKGERKGVRLLAHDAGDLRRNGGASNSILTTWRISFERIRSERPSAADLFSLMSFFDRQGIPEDLLRCPDRSDHDKDVEAESSVGETDSAFEDDVAMLRDYCLVTVVTVSDTGATFTMHSLVQLSTRMWLQEYELEQPFQSKFIELMVNAFPEPDHTNWTTCRALFSHVQAAAGYQPAEGDEEELWATLLHNGGFFAYEDANYVVAEQMLHKACSSREKMLGPGAIATLKSRIVWAGVLDAQGQEDEADKMREEAVDTLQRTHGRDHPMALLLVRQGKPEEAKDPVCAALEFYKRELGPYDPRTVDLMENLVHIYAQLGQWDEANKIAHENLEARKVHWGPDHHETLNAMTLLSFTLTEQGSFERAEELQLEVLEARKSQSGMEHPETLAAMHNLAWTWMLQGRNAEAIEQMGKCAEARKRVLGPQHPQTALSMKYLREWKGES